MIWPGHSDVVKYIPQAVPVSDEVKQRMLADYEKYDQVLEEKKRAHREKNPDKYQSVDQEDDQNVFYRSLIGKLYTSLLPSL